MKGIVAYDSVYGNTRLVAEAISNQLMTESHEIELVALGSGSGTASGGDFMFIGSPTRVGRMTKSTKEFIRGLDVRVWSNRPIVAFDTVGPLPKGEEKLKKWLERIDKGASNRIQDLARERGLSVYPEPLHIAVTGFKGPLASDALDSAKEFAHKFIATLK